jgi:hypothetical protein
MSKKNCDHPLSKRHLSQIVRRCAKHRAQMFGVWGITWRPGGNAGSFTGNLSRPLGSATMMTQISFPREGNREGIGLFGIGARIEPQQAIVSYDDLRMRHDFHRVPFVGARGAILDPSEEKRGGRGNGSWVQLALEVDRLRQRAASRHYRLPVVPRLPRILYGYGSKEVIPFEATPALRELAAARLEVEWSGASLGDLRRFEAEASELRRRKFEELSPEVQQGLLYAAWESAIVSPVDPSNSTGLWLLPHELSHDVYRSTRIYEHFGDLVGANIFNPARQFGRVVTNPAVEVAKIASVDLLADLASLAAQGEGSPECQGVEERLVGLIPAYRKRLSASAELSDQDLLHALCQPEQQVAISRALDTLAEAEQIARMRAVVLPHLAPCCTDADLLAAVRSPHEPLFASGLCRVQCLYRPPRVPVEEALRFLSPRLERERVEAMFWFDKWTDSPNIAATRSELPLVAA